MKLRISLTLSLSLFLVTLLPAQGERYTDWTLEDVVEQIEESNGGEKALDEIKTVRIKGSVVSPDTSYDFVMLKKRPNKLRIQLMYKGASAETGYNGEYAWRRERKGNQSRMKRLTEDEFQEARLDVDFDGPLIGPPQGGMELELIGTERIDRVLYFVIESSYPNRSVRHYVDARTFREAWSVSEVISSDGSKEEHISIYEDYKRHGPIWMAERIIRKLPDGREEEIKVVDVDVNTGILDRAFEMPRSSD
jgi:hypothetical protein